MKSNISFINVYKKKNLNSKVVTQILYGDTFKIIKNNGKWLKIKNNMDNYKGFIIRKNFLLDKKNTHKVSKLFAKIYSKPNLKFKINTKLSFGSRIQVVKKKSSFYKFEKFWIQKKDLKKINFRNRDVFNDIKKFSGVKYKWGGKHFTGIDCSGLVQVFFNYNNQYCPRDTKDQIKFFKKNVNIENIRKNDLIFWKGHVAIALSKKSLIHAYGPLKKTIIMSIKDTIDRIYKTANLNVLRIKRIS